MIRITFDRKIIESVGGASYSTNIAWVSFLLAQNYYGRLLNIGKAAVVLGLGIRRYF